MRGTLRWARADLRGHRGQALLTIGVVAAVAAALLLATMLLQGALNPWQQLFNRTHGADVLIYFQNGTNTRDLSSLPGVQQVGQPYRAASATLEQGPVKSPVELRALKPVPPTVSAPLVVAGTWLRAPEPDGAVLEASFAQAVHVGIGDQIAVVGIDGIMVRMRVIGIADTADQGFYPQWTPGLIWVQSGLLTKVEPHSSETQEVVGLRLDDNSAVATGQVVQTIFNLYNGPAENSAVERYSTWQQVQNSMANNDRLIGLLLALFGIIALVAAPCAIANVTAGRVLVQRQDIAMLKALGFTPGQVVRMLLAEQTALGAAGAVLGLVAARIMTSSEFVRPPDGTPVGLAPLSGSWAALIVVGTVLTVAVATVIPAWWAGKVSPVAAVQPSPPRGHLSLIARLGLLVHLPAPLVLGARDCLTRRLPAALTVLGLAIPMVMITIALTCWSTIDGFTRDPGRIGLAAAVTVSQGGLNSKQTLALISHDDQVLASYPGAQFDTLLPGDNGTFIARAMGTSSRPYPFQVIQGQKFRAANEAVAGQGFLDLMHIGVGAWISPTIDGVPMILHIVGRTIEPDNNGDVVDFGLDALHAAGGAPPQLFYSLVLKPGVPAAAAQAQLLKASDNQLDVQLVANPADGLGVVQAVIAVAVVLLAVIGLANLLTATAVGLRDHLHEVGVLKAMGLTPRQVMATLVVNTAILTVIGVGSGIIAGLVIAPRLINMQGRTSGLGSGIATSLSVAAVAEILALALAIAMAAALFLARRTTRISDSPQLSSPVRPSRPQAPSLRNF
ncbi:MAG TPA: FtsX-like permease family protein [Streptosporangiaceae bacterium]|nr:FtsX-like permease family protein [Streptosporangiaceae bacterium]